MNEWFELSGTNFGFFYRFRWSVLTYALRLEREAKNLSVKKERIRQRGLVAWGFRATWNQNGRAFFLLQYQRERERGCVWWNWHVYILNNRGRFCSKVFFFGISPFPRLESGTYDVSLLKLFNYLLMYCFCGLNPN